MMIDDDENDDDDVDQPTVDAGHDKGFAGNVETPAATFSSHHLSIVVLHFFHLSPYNFGYFSTFFENSEWNCQKLKLLINARFLC